jgi:hypothetical protein
VENVTPGLAAANVLRLPPGPECVRARMCRQFSCVPSNCAGQRETSRSTVPAISPGTAYLQMMHVRLIKTARDQALGAATPMLRRATVPTLATLASHRSRVPRPVTSTPRSWRIAFFYPLKLIVYPVTDYRILHMVLCCAETSTGRPPTGHWAPSSYALIDPHKVAIVCRLAGEAYSAGSDVAS